MKKVFISIFLFPLFVSFLYAQTDPALVVGEYKIEKVIDGDTFRFEGLDSSTRLLAIDTEESFKDRDALLKTNEIARNWEQYYATLRGDSKFPVKTDSPMGYAATLWAEEFFKNVDKVRLERDNITRDRDMFGRYLVYVIALMKDGTEINYNLECVRLGYSPYFDKYGRSERFHDEFVAAQNYARENKLGVWDHVTNKAYPDYDERIAWWNKRAQQIEDFKEFHSDNPYYFNLLEAQEYERLKDYVGETVTVFGSISEILTRRFPYIMRIPITRTNSFEIVIFERNKNIYDEVDFKTLREYNVYVKGKLTEYNGRLQIVLNNKDQIWMD